MTRNGVPRVLFGWKPEWKAGCEGSARRAGCAPEMQRLDEAAYSAFDAIVPLTLEDQAILEERDVPEGALPSLIVPSAQRRICDDKLGFARLMCEAGLGDHVPRLLDPDKVKDEAFPAVVKARHGEYGRGAFMVQNLAELEAHRSQLASGAAFLQEVVPGSEEYAVHILLREGMMLFAAAIHYTMPGPNLVKGALHKPLARRWLPSAPFKPLWHDVLRKLGIVSGTVCIDYRLRDGRPVIFEINPRVGSSLAARMEAYLQVYLSCFGMPPRLSIG